MDELFDFNKRKNWKGALLFYFVTLIMCFICGGIIGAVHNKFFLPPPEPGASLHASFQRGFESGLAVGRIAGPIIGFLFSTGFAVIIMRAKKLYTARTILCTLAGTILALLLGSFAGLIPTAYMTTLQPADGAAAPPPSPAEGEF